MRNTPQECEPCSTSLSPRIQSQWAEQMEDFLRRIIHTSTERKAVRHFFLQKNRPPRHPRTNMRRFCALRVTKPRSSRRNYTLKEPHLGVEGGGDLLLYVIGTDRAISIDAMCTGFRSHRHGDSTNIGSDRDRQPHIQEAARFSALGRHLSRFLSVVKLKNSVAWIAILNSLY